MKTPKTLLLISQQPNITQRPFCIQNELQGYPLSPHIKAIAVAFLQADCKATKNLNLKKFEKNTQPWVYGAHPSLRLQPETRLFDTPPAKIR